jgi:hypothetical protein
MNLGSDVFFVVYQVYKLPIQSVGSNKLVPFKFFHKKVYFCKYNIYIYIYILWYVQPTKSRILHHYGG